jgi:hypothetical protein
MRNYLRNLTLALDRFLNVVFFYGKADETISYNAATAEKNGKKWGCLFCKFLHWVDHNHCERTLRDEQTGDMAGLRLLGLLLVLFYILAEIVA